MGKNFPHLGTWQLVTGRRECQESEDVKNDFDVFNLDDCVNGMSRLQWRTRQGAGLKWETLNSALSKHGELEFVYLLRALSDCVFAELVFSETLYAHRFSFTLPPAIRQFQRQKRSQKPLIASLGRSMHRFSFLLWALALRQASGAAIGDMTGRILTAGNISAEEGGSVTFHCHLSHTNANVTQIHWLQQDQFLAVHHANLGWHIPSNFRDRVSPGPNLDITLQSLTKNDTGEYFCTFHTYPDGIYKGRLFLEVLQNSVAKHSTVFQMPFLGVLAALLVVICIAVIVVAAQFTKNKLCGTHSAGNDLKRTASEHEAWNPSIPSIPGTWAPDSPCREQGDENYADLHDYFNVLSYRSLGNSSFLVETS
ncbi:T-cell immunoreceptor with Ig and ITIM domains [Sorex fumeus]|uniref:T-cell immunoreceptor with Ig and ITIM domains n=1 Tax=Sorex fumeus TaxID=62283 RepID=UPI0024AD92E7|nr:T-cell immunoreceptor with Ig and ITIM domains [Sorex fumeus]